MTAYAVYLEYEESGPCLAHILDLPGCAVRAPGRSTALGRLPEAIRSYHAWLRRHGEPAPPPGEPIQVEVAGESKGLGPFGPGDAAALFPPDREPLAAEDMAHYFRLMAHSRADLLALVHAPSTATDASLPDKLLDWQPAPGSWTVRRVLRHVGNAEEWYVSRLVPAETLPAEWQHDEDLPIFEFLAMERRTAIARLQQLSPEERSGVQYPARWTKHPEEPWTARKALRRFLEHEREHTAQIREVLAARRDRLLAHLAAEREALLRPLAGLEEVRLTEEPVLGDWSVKDVLVHVAAWDRWQDQAMRSLLAGGVPDFAESEDVDVFNARAVAQWRDRSLAEVMAELRAARSTWVAWLHGLSEEAFFRPRSVESWDWSFPTCLADQWQHDAEHAQQLAAWREAEARP
jgi:uncharacterized damage-inducible protein DinB/predicted RNase H-like HicB family nuclease